MAYSWLTRGSLGALGMHADDSGVSRGTVGAETGEESALFVAPSATSGQSRGTFLSSLRSFGTDKQYSNSNGRILGAFWADSWLNRVESVVIRGYSGVNTTGNS